MKGLRKLCNLVLAIIGGGSLGFSLMILTAFFFSEIIKVQPYSTIANFAVVCCFVVWGIGTYIGIVVVDKLLPPKWKIDM